MPRVKATYSSSSHSISRRVFGLALASLCLGANLASAADSASGVALKLVAEGLTSPSVLVPFDDGSGRMLLAQQTGPLHLMAKDGKLQPFLDLTGRLATLKKGFDERGVLGVALHPKFRQNGKFFVCYSAPKRADAPADWDHTMNISEFKVDAKNKAQGDASSERVLLQIDKPYFNHNGGRIAFGSDGYLYIGVGDGGNANDTGKRPETGNGQNLDTLMGKILRIDVDKGNPYAIPSDNPFAKGGGKPEIFAYGIRNPWGMTFDRGGTRELFASEVGQSAYEEVNIIRNGGNYGWNVKEGPSWFDPKKALVPSDSGRTTDARGQPFIDPPILYKNLKVFPQEGKGISITGGYVYRGKALPALVGKYIFADWSKHMALPQGVLLAASRADKAGLHWTLEQLIPTTHPKENLGLFVWAFGEDEQGELYLLTNGNNGVVGTTGKIFKLVPASEVK
jgi:glucose/arabinose dehydrogenase